MNDFRPVPKPPKKEKKPYAGLQTRKPLQAKTPLKAKTELKAKSIIKSRPDLVEKRPKQKKSKKREQAKVIREGLQIPEKKVRSEFTDRERKLINEAFNGAYCAECQSPYIQHHHAKFRSGSGRGVWRNGVPLCDTHHRMCHDSRAYADKWRTLLEIMYGPFYFMDKWDLWLMGAIENPTYGEYNRFMIEQEKEARFHAENN